MPLSKFHKKTNRTWYIELLGWYGVLATITAYALVSASILEAQSLWYQGLNLTGAIGITIETYYHRDYQPFWLNLIWAAIAFIALLSIIRLHT